MSRPRIYAPRTLTTIRFTKDIHTRLLDAAEARDVSANFLVNTAVEQFLDQLIPVDEMQWTRSTMMTGFWPAKAGKATHALDPESVAERGRLEREQQ